ncbi:MAG TPA: hypothetical protein VEK08_23380 [Planctomycetota bacterium]|nr:hypothetical protein [Planctomycetota bacterium]
MWVSAEGGRPTRVEAVKKMDCELQNAAIRKWFSEAKFPSSGSDCVHQIPVKMMMEE